MPPPIVSTGSSYQSLRVLLIDDDNFMLELISDILHDIGIANITTAGDGRQGMTAFEAAKPAPDIIICDINMPDKDGFQLMELLAEKKYGGGVILVSGLTSRVINSATLMANFHHLNILGALPKPIEKHALAALISKQQSPP